MKTEKKFHQFVWDFRKAIELKQQTFTTKKFFGIESVLDGLYLDGLIAGYKIMVFEKEEAVQVVLKTDISGALLVSFVKSAAKPSHRISARIKELKVQSAHRNYMSCVIRTAKYGFITARAAVKYKVGGIFAARVY